MSARPVVNEERVVHCWSKVVDEEGRSYSCMERNGHGGPHRFVADSEAPIRAAPPAREETT